MIIAIDGSRRVGKSTIVSNLEKQYKDNKNIVFVKHPTDSNIGNLAQNARTMEEHNDVLSLLFAADLAKIYRDVICSDPGKIYICDRYVLSLFVFECGDDSDHLQFLRHITGKIDYPDMQIVIYTEENGRTANEDLFVTTAKNLEKDQVLSNLYCVKNTLSHTEVHDLTGYLRVKEIIDAAIAQV
jgi:thymidylate kinase